MALGRKKKEESTNDKIIRLYQEGKSVEDIVGEVALRADIVTGVIQRKLGPDAVPDAAIPHEKPQAAKVIGAVNGDKPEAAPAGDGNADEDVEGMSKLERYMFEKKKKMESSAETAPAAPSEPAPGEMEGISAATIPAPPEPEAPAPSLVAETEKEPEVHRVSLVEDYKKQAAAKENGSASRSGMNGISLSSPNVPSAPNIPSYTVPSPGEEYAEMEALVPPDVESADISDAPILAYSGEPEPAAPAVEEAPAAAEPVAAAPAPEIDTASKAADKMKAFAMSQIEANNVKIAELEGKNAVIKNDYTAKINEATTALTLSQSNYDTIESKLNEAYAAAEKAREENRLAIAKAEEEYNRKMAAIDEEYRNATFEANNKFQEFDDKNRETIVKLDEEKSAAQADLVVKRKAVADIHQMIDGESEKLTAQIKALKDENAGYQAFLN